MNQTRKIIIILLLGVAIIISGLGLAYWLQSGRYMDVSVHQAIDLTTEEQDQISRDEEKRLNLYLAVMESFKDYNNHDEFVAIKENTLDGLSTPAINILKSHLTLSPTLYNYEDIKTSDEFFVFNNDDQLIGTTGDGVILSINVQKYEGNKAQLTGVYWYGNLGADIHIYDARYKNGKWVLKLKSIMTT